jgi:hypothetical protein
MTAKNLFKVCSLLISLPSFFNEAFVITGANAGGSVGRAKQIGIDATGASPHDHDFVGAEASEPVYEKHKAEDTELGDRAEKRVCV